MTNKTYTTHLKARSVSPHNALRAATAMVRSCRSFCAIRRNGHRNLEDAPARKPC